MLLMPRRDLLAVAEQRGSCSISADVAIALNVNISAAFFFQHGVATGFDGGRSNWVQVLEPIALRSVAPIETTHARFGY